MPLADAERWNQRYINGSRYTFAQPRTLLTEHAAFLPPSGLGLDLAMGLGGNAGYLLSRGLQVVGVDIAEVAVRKARQANPNLAAVVADLTCFDFPSQVFDVICNFYYLNRPYWPHMERWLKPGGVLYFETLTEAMREFDPQINPLHLLKPNELRSAFPSLQVLHYQEGWYNDDHPRASARLIARKPPE